MCGLGQRNVAFFLSALESFLDVSLCFTTANSMPVHPVEDLFCFIYETDFVSTIDYIEEGVLTERGRMLAVQRAD